MKRILFLCTGNYYRSRYAEELFNHLARREGLNWEATSAALAIERGIDNVGRMSRSTLDALEADDVRAAGTACLPRRCTATDLAEANLVVAVKEAEHRNLLADRFPGWQDRVIYWHVHDVDAAHPVEALSQLRRLVGELLRSLS
jgi:protein-tyrosine-phosphatase